MKKDFWLVPLTALLAVSAGCGGGNDQPTPAADRASARAATLKAADFPAGWKSSPHRRLPGEEAMATDVARCLGISSPSTRATAQVVSSDFSSGLATQATAVIIFVKSDGEAATDAAAYASGKFPSCAMPGFKDQIQQVAPDGAEVRDVRITKVPFPSSGDRTAAHRVKADLQVGEMTVPINIDLVHIVKGRAEVALTFVNPGEPFPPDLARSLAAKVAARL